MVRTRWAAIGAAVAVTLGGGGLGIARASIDSGVRPVTVTIEPQRILDTRENLGLSGSFVSDTPRDVQVTGSVPVASGGSAVVVPADAVAVLVNVTVVTPDSDGFLSLRPAGATGIPRTSTVNFTAGSVTPNSATVDLAAGGLVQVYVKTASATGTAHVLIDVVGYTVDHTFDDRYYTEAETDAALGAKANSADVYTKTEVDAALAGKAVAPFVQTGSSANDPFVGFLGPAFSLDAACGDAEGCQITLIRELDGTRYLFGPITFQISGNQWWTFANGSGGSTAAGTNGDATTQVILGTNGLQSCFLSDWDSSGSTLSGDQNGNFAVIRLNTTGNTQTCTLRVDD